MQVHVIRTDGREEDHAVPNGSGALPAIYRLIGCDTIDTVNLRDGRVMLVDDNGWDTRFEERPYGGAMIPVRPRKPINAKATTLYHGVCVPGTTHQIVGDVAIAWDREFA